jgi:hypothetical protein
MQLLQQTVLVTRRKSVWVLKRFIISGYKSWKQLTFHRAIYINIIAVNWCTAIREQMKLIHGN